jgi:hypothetical protein
VVPLVLFAHACSDHIDWRGSQTRIASYIASGFISAHRKSAFNDFRAKRIIKRDGKLFVLDERITKSHGEMSFFECVMSAIWKNAAWFGIGRLEHA